MGRPSRKCRSRNELRAAKCRSRNELHTHEVIEHPVAIVKAAEEQEPPAMQRSAVTGPHKHLLLRLR